MSLLDFRDNSGDSGGEKKSRSAGKPLRPKREYPESELVYRKKIQELREQGKDHEALKVLYVLLDTLNRLIPVAEENYHDYPAHTNAAAVNNLSDQLRETLQDIQALEDFSKRSEIICDFVAQQYKLLMQSAIADTLNAQKIMTAKPDTADVEWTRIRTAMAKRFSESEKTVRARVTQLLHVKT